MAAWVLKGDLPEGMQSQTHAKKKKNPSVLFCAFQMGEMYSKLVADSKSMNW